MERNDIFNSMLKSVKETSQHHYIKEPQGFASVVESGTLLCFFNIINEIGYNLKLKGTILIN